MTKNELSTPNNPKSRHILRDVNNALALTVYINLAVVLLGVNYANAGFTGKYCELDGAETDTGVSVSGACYMYSENYGELDGAETDTGVSVSGACYRYSQDYAELESAETDEGVDVSGECYFY
jgi:hypothetical protein